MRFLLNLMAVLAFVGAGVTTGAFYEEHCDGAEVPSWVVAISWPFVVASAVVQRVYDPTEGAMCAADAPQQEAE